MDFYLNRRAALIFVRLIREASSRVSLVIVRQGVRRATPPVNPEISVAETVESSNCRETKDERAPVGYTCSSKR